MEAIVKFMFLTVRGTTERRKTVQPFSLPFGSSHVAPLRPVYLLLLLLLLALTCQVAGSDVIRIGELNMNQLLSINLVCSEFTPGRAYSRRY